MKNAAIAALVSALVAVGFAGAASPTPVADNSRVARDITKLKAQVAQLQTNFQCFDGTILQMLVQKNPGGLTYYVQPDSDQDPTATYVPTVDPSCVG